MSEYIELMRGLILSHSSLEYLIIFVGTAVGGELALFILGFLAAQGVVSPIGAVIFGFSGSFLPNILWFYIGNVNMVRKISRYNRHAESTSQIITEAVRRVSKGSHMIALIIIKFLVGTPVILVLYAKETGIKFKEFMYCQSVAMILSMLVIVPIGYLSGQGYSYLSDVFQNVYAAIGFLIIVAFIIAAFQIWLERMFTKN